MFKQAKYKKFRKGRLKKLEFKTNNLKFGTFGLKAAESGVIKSSQILSAKQIILKKIKKKVNFEFVHFRTYLFHLNQ